MKGLHVFKNGVLRKIFGPKREKRSNKGQEEIV
jgi:hypothetical protein